VTRVATIIPTTPTEMVVEAERLEAEATALRLGLDKATERLNKTVARLEALSTLVEKQAQHLAQLKVRCSEGQVIFLPDYSEMRLKHAQHRLSIAEARTAIAAIRVDLAAKKSNLAMVDSKLKQTREFIGSRGKLIPFRKRT